MVATTPLGRALQENTLAVRVRTVVPRRCQIAATTRAKVLPTLLMSSGFAAHQSCPIAPASIVALLGPLSALQMIATASTTQMAANRCAPAGPS